MGPLQLANISKHLTEDVIDQVFKLKTNSDDNVRSIEVTRAAAAGEGMISAVFRIKVSGDHHKANFVAKGLVQDAVLRESIKCAKFFKREAEFFTDILPLLIKVQKSSGAKERIQSVIPICYKCHTDGLNDYILLEDLSDKNFVSSSPHPTKSERDMILKVLAHFHSVSVALRIKEPELFTKIANRLSDVYYNKDNKDWFANYLKNALVIDKNVVAEIEGTDSVYYKKLEKITQTDVYEQLIKLATTRGNHPVLNHGDAWCPNFLFKKDQVVTIDFQILRCASPVADLSFFIFLSGLCQNKEDFFEALTVYHNSLQYYLQDMGFDANKVIPLNALKEEVGKYGLIGFLASLTTIPLMASDRSTSDVLQSPEVNFAGYIRIPLELLWRLTPITSKKYKMQLVNGVRVAVDLGLI